MHEELADHTAEVILQTLFSVVLTYEKPFDDISPTFLAIMLTTMLNVSRDHEKLKKLKQKIEEKFSKTVFAKIHDFTTQ